MASLKSRLEHSVTLIALQSYLAEFNSTFFFVFVAAGATKSSRKMMPDVGSDSSTLVAIAVANAFALSVCSHVPTHAIGHEMIGFGAALLEGVMNFALVYTVYVASNLRPVFAGAIGPLFIGLIAGANVLASGPFTGGSMNLAYAFGSAIVGESFKNQAVYWVGPLIGAAVAGILLDNEVFPPPMPNLLRENADGVGV